MGSCPLYCPIHFVLLLETALQVNVQVVGALPDVLCQSQPRSYALFAGLVGVQVVEDVLRDPGRGMCSGTPPERSSPARRCTRKSFETHRFVSSISTVPSKFHVEFLIFHFVSIFEQRHPFQKCILVRSFTAQIVFSSLTSNFFVN
jgi:hypothetical protein